MRFRLPFLGAFIATALLSAYLGLIPASNPTPVNDKALHFLAFFALTLTGYWATDSPRRVLLRIVSLASLLASVGSEFAQNIVNPSRQFDVVDIAANALGGLLALAASAWYHKRMLERKRRRKLAGYGLVAEADTMEADLELGEVGVDGREDDEGRADAVEEGEADDDGEAWDDLDGADTVKADGGLANTNGHENGNGSVQSGKKTGPEE